jgi:polysaccharide pyruvyl transferase WcaK-like protein
MKRPVRVALIGEYGEGNYGNEATLAHAIRVVRSVEGTHITVICHRPERVSAQHAVDAVPFVLRHPRSRVDAIAAKARDVSRAARLVAAADLVIVPGNGPLELNGVRAGALPFLLFVYSAWAAILRTPFLALGIGSDGRGSRAARLLAGFAVARASYVSARDEETARDLARYRRAPVAVVADAVLGDAPHERTRALGARRRVGLGVVDYSGPGGLSSPDADATARYVRRMAAVTQGLLDRDCDVVILRGQDSDDPIVSRLLTELGEDERVSVAQARSVPELGREIANLELLVACRYHNLVAAVVERVPLIAIGWAKQRAIAGQVGRSQAFFDIESFTAAEVLAEVDTSLARGGEGAAEAAENLARAVAQQDADLARLLSGRIPRRHVLRSHGIGPAIHAIGAAAQPDGVALEIPRQQTPVLDSPVREDGS